MNTEQLAALAEPFPSRLVQWRAATGTGSDGKARVVAYLDARDVADRLTSVDPAWCSKMVSFGPYTTPDGSLHFAVECALTVCGIARSDVGEIAVSGDRGYQDAAKGAASDAFKRAAVQFGVARYLYNLGNTRAKLDNYGNVIDPPALPDWALSSEDKPPKRDVYKQAAPGPQQPKKPVAYGNDSGKGGELTDEAIDKLKIKAKEIWGVDAWSDDLAKEVLKALGVKRIDDFTGDFQAAVKAMEAYYTRGEESFDAKDASKVVTDLREEATKGRDPNADITDPQKQHLPGALAKLFPDTGDADSLRHNLMDAVFGKKHTEELTKGEASALFSLVYVGGRGADQYDMKPDAVVNAATILGVYKGRKLFEDMPF